MPSEREIHLPAKLCEDAERKYGERFGSLEQFLIHLLQQLVKDEATRMDQADQAMVEARLKDLGYI